MPAFLLPVLIRLAGAVVIALAVWGAWYKVNHWCNAACVVAMDMVAERDASIAATQARATALALLWSAQVDKTENAAHISESLRNEKFAALKAEAAAVPHGHLGGISLLDRARSAASGTATGPAPKPDEAAPAPASSAEEFVISLYEWAAVCRARVDEWSSFYRGLQQASQ